MKKWIIGGIALLVLIAAVSSSSSSSSQTGSSDDAVATTQAADSGSKSEKKSAKKSEKKSENSDSGSKAEEKQSCGIQATDDCTPHVAENGKVRVDALYWQVNSVKTADTIGDMSYGLGEKADGVFVVVNLKVRSAKDESVTLTDNAFQLEVNGKTYDSDSEGTIAAVGAGEDPFFLEDIGPDATSNGKVVFDVPKSVLNKKVDMRFNELGFGSTHGYINLSSLSA